MSEWLALSVRFLSPVFHGRGDGGAAEWPPSPLRLFQAIVAASARAALLEEQRTVDALNWLAEKGAPIIVAPPFETPTGFCVSVPNNAMDLMARAWTRKRGSGSGRDGGGGYRALKRIRPTWMRGTDGTEVAVHFLWRIGCVGTADRGAAEALCGLVEGLHSLGWGIDFVVGSGAFLPEAEIRRLRGEWWHPSDRETREGLRVAVVGTLDGLKRRHADFLRRIDGGVYVAPRPLSEFRVVRYRRAIDRPPVPVAAVALRRADSDDLRSFDPVRRGLTVAGMIRHAAESGARRGMKDGAWVGSFVLGHGEEVGATHKSVGNSRLAILPLPSVEWRGATGGHVIGGIRRVALCSFDDTRCEDVEWVQRALDGAPLIDERTRETVAVLSSLGRSDRMLRAYTDPAATWSTVTPVVLPGYDDRGGLRRRACERGVGAQRQKDLLARLSARIDGLLRRAIVQAGFAPVLAERAELEWRRVGFLPGTELASRYGVPDHLARYPRYHVRVHWRDEQGRPAAVAGPVCIGGGRFYGLGLFAPER